jgi:alpha-D-xyloside xylohydrolase
MKKILPLSILLSGVLMTDAQTVLNFKNEGRSILFTNTQGERMRITPYGDHIVRIQTVQKGQDFFPDDHYEMVESHDWPGAFTVKEEKNSFQLTQKAANGITVSVDKNQLQVSFFEAGKNKAFLAQSRSVWESGDSLHNSFVYDASEHFTGLGHSYYGRAESVDLKGQLIARNYGSQHTQQAPLLVPFYLSNKGYGVFLNSTYQNLFSFGKNDNYEFSISGEGRIDFFVILGPKISQILDYYTQLTGRPRFPMKSIFGLGLSDKGNDEKTADPSDENWWKRKIAEHRAAGFPIDHIINDNRWRAGGGQRCISYYEWDSSRYPSPREYEKWIKANGLISTIDFNRCIAVKSEGWKPSFNLPESEGIDFNTSAPDFTKQETRDWFWNIMWTKALNPALQYPGDALWIDEFDEMGKAPLTMKFENGTTWKEMKNYWFFLIAKSLVQQGWDKNFKGTKRPFVWVRGMTAGAQRYATLWSGDIDPTFKDMKLEIRGMQLAGLSAFPFWGHDAGGFQIEPNDTIYKQWAMAMGSFSPFWKPHGVGKSRWPLDRSANVQKTAKIYCTLRYELMPYTYTFAHLASETGMPMVRAMLIDNQNEPMAWKSDLQYMWGDDMLVAPNCSVGDNVKVWLPKGGWYDFWNDSLLKGNQVLDYPAPLGKLPLFIKAGAIIPMANFALSTAFIPADSLNIHVYTGKDGSFNLYEDDGITEAYRDKNEKRITAIHFQQSTLALTIDAAKGTYANAPVERAYEIIFHGLSKPVSLEVNGVKAKAIWNADKKTLSVLVPKTSVAKELIVKKVGN